MNDSAVPLKFPEMWRQKPEMQKWQQMQHGCVGSMDYLAVD